MNFIILLQDNPCPHPIIILRDIKYEDLQHLLQFMYNGEVNVAQESLNSFLKSAESLKIRGLTDEEDKKRRRHLPNCQASDYREEEKLEFQDQTIKDEGRRVKTPHKEAVKKEIQELSDRNDNQEEGSNRDVIPLLEDENIDDPDEETGEVLDGAQGNIHLYVHHSQVTPHSNSSIFRCRWSGHEWSVKVTLSSVRDSAIFPLSILWQGFYHTRVSEKSQQSSLWGDSLPLLSKAACHSQ